jgi:hypothetical protein
MKISNFLRNFNIKNMAGYLMKVLLDSSRTVVIVTASAKENDRGGQGHTSVSLFHQSAM